MTNAEKQRPKQYLEDNIPFYELKKAGFWVKGTRKTDYEKIASRICWYFGFENIYQYSQYNAFVTSETATVENGKFADTVDKNGKIHREGGYHLDVVETAFTCPICECPQDATQHAAYNNPKALPVVKVKCKGCKRPLILCTDIGGNLTVMEKIK